MGKVKTKPKKKPMTQPRRSSRSRGESILIKDCPCVEITLVAAEGAGREQWALCLS